MFRRILLAAGLFAFAIDVPAHSLASTVPHAAVTVVAQSLPPLFSSEEAAQAHCPRDTVVWLNIPSGIYHYRGQRWYGDTKYGAYACEKEAIRAGDRATENGQ
jgi:hypothetical protein